MPVRVCRRAGQHQGCRLARDVCCALWRRSHTGIVQPGVRVIPAMCACVCYNIENVKEQHQGEAERHSIQRYVCVCVLQHRECKRGRKTSLNDFGCRNVSTCTESGAAHTCYVCVRACVKLMYQLKRQHWLCALRTCTYLWCTAYFFQWKNLWRVEANVG